MKMKKMKKNRGLTLLELIITLAIVATLAAAALPLAYNTVRRNREIELRRALREMRMAIDRYKQFNDSTVPPGVRIPIQEKTPSGYPKNLKILVEGFVPANSTGDKKVRFLRKLPIDPMTGEDEWQTRSSTDEPEDDNSNEEDVFDVHSKSEGTALDGTKYKDW